MPAPSHTYIPLHRVAAALPFINYLRQAGVPLERELRRAIALSQAGTSGPLLPTLQSVKGLKMIWVSSLACNPGPMPRIPG